MFKEVFIIFSLLVLIAPVLSSAQTSPPSLPNLPDLGQSITAPISNFVDKLKAIGGSNVSVPDASNFDLGPSGVQGTWDNINNWFVSKIGVSLTDIIKAVVNLIIWVWELIIKLIQVGLSYL